MKTRLTKNDSISAVVKDFYVLVAAFEAILNRKNAHKSFFEEWAKYHNYRGTANTFFAWRRSIRFEHPSGWVMMAFIWQDSKEGLCFWEELENEWMEWLKRNLNK